MKRAVYAGSFDPLTNGHLWMIQEALALFDEVVVAVGINPKKNYSFSKEDRIALLQLATQHLPRLQITALENQFLVSYAQSIQAHYIVRGIRSYSDYEYEKNMRQINQDIAPDIQTIFLMPPRQLAEISSSMVKGLIGPEGFESLIRQYVPDAVADQMIAMHAAQTA